MLCPICNHSMSLSLYRKPGLSIVTCDNCKFYAADLDEWAYPYSESDYYTKQIDADAIQPQRPHIQHRIQKIMRFKTAGKAVDLGCGLGETAIALDQAGYQAYGVEESENAIRFLKDTYQTIRWYCMPIEQFLEQERDFDLITLFHVLEHIPKLHLLCESITRSLRPGGLLVVEVPDVSGGQARLHRWGWQHWLPHHVNYFSRKSLCRLFDPFGLELINVEFKYHLGFPQGILWRDLIHGSLARFGMHDIITTYWRKSV